MSDSLKAVEVKTTSLSYLGWRGELLAELALARVPGLTIEKRPARLTADFRFDFRVTTKKGAQFFVEIDAFSSFDLDIAEVETVPELKWTLVHYARQSGTLVLLFVFDADTGHGRYLRLDTLPEPDLQARRLTVRLPLENTITRENLRKLISELPVPPKS